MNKISEQSSEDIRALRELASGRETVRGGGDDEGEGEKTYTAAAPVTTTATTASHRAKTAVSDTIRGHPYPRSC